MATPPPPRRTKELRESKEQRRKHHEESALRLALQTSKSREGSSAGEEAGPRPGLGQTSSIETPSTLPLLASSPMASQSAPMVTDSPSSSSSGSQTPGPSGTGQASDSANVSYVVAQEDLRKLIQGAVRDLARQNAERAAPVDRSKGLKLAEQPDFTGRPEDLQDFLSNCEMMFVLKLDVYGRNDND